MNFRLSSDCRIGAVCTLLLLACEVEEASVGANRCPSADPVCAEPIEEGQLDFFPEKPVSVDTSNLLSLSPSWERPLPAGDASFEDAFVGNASSGLWYLKSQIGGPGIEVYAVVDGEPDENDLAGATSVLRKSFVAAPLATDLPVEYNPDTIARGPVRFQSMLASSQRGAPPVLDVRWRYDCESKTGEEATCGGVEIIAFRADPSSAPLRIFPPLGAAYGTPIASNDGGVWSFGVDVLRKYDENGRLSAEPALPTAPIPADLMGRGGKWIVGEPQLAVAPSGDVIMLVLGSGGGRNPEVWHLDNDGAAVFYASWWDTDATYPVVDQLGRAVLISMTQRGDLALRRFHLRGYGSVSYHLIERADYTQLVLGNVAEDAAGNLYLLTHTGPKDAAVPTVCMLPLGGDVQCYRLPQANIRGIVGGPEHVIYAASRASLADEELLQRYDFP